MGGTDEGALTLVGTLWLWLSIYLSSFESLYFVGEQSFMSRKRPSLLPRAAQSTSCPQYRLNRRLKRRLGKPIAPVSQLHFYRHLNNERLGPTQYLERLTRLSPLGRIRIYRLGMRRQILTWREAAQGHEQSCALQSLLASFCAAPLSPD